MASETEDLLRGSKEEWERAEQAVDRLIAAHHNLMRDGGDAEDRPSSRDAAAPAAPTATPAKFDAERSASALAPAAQSSRPHWPKVILLAAVWLSVALVVSAAILSVAKLL